MPTESRSMPKEVFAISSLLAALLQANGDSPIDLTAPKTPSISPFKKRINSIPKSLQSSLTKEQEARARQRAFNKEKRRIARDWVDLLDEKITGGLISKLTASTGGIKIEWSKTLRTTAGHASGYRSGPDDGLIERIWKSKKGVSQFPGMGTRYYAKIKLAEHVLTDEQRLIDTTAHEFAHLCEMLVEHRGDRRLMSRKHHGRIFKQW